MNLALVIAGCVLVIMSPIWRLVVAPALKVVAGDFDFVYFYEGSLLVHSGPTESTTPTALEQFVISRPDLSSESVSAVREQLRLFDKRTQADLDSATHYLAMNRQTGELRKAKGCKSASGFYIVFPFNSPKGDVPVWIQRARAAVKARFVKEDTVQGVKVYRYDLEYHNLPCSPPPGFSNTVSVGDVIAQLPEGFSAGAADPLAATYPTAGKASYFVEPRMGSIADIRNVEESVAMKIQSSTLSATSLVYRLQYKMNSSAVKTASTFARDEASKLRLQTAWIPI